VGARRRILKSGHEACFNHTHLLNPMTPLWSDHSAFMRSFSHLDSVSLRCSLETQWILQAAHVNAMLLFFYTIMLIACVLGWSTMRTMCERMASFWTWTCIWYPLPSVVRIHHAFPLITEAKLTRIQSIKGWTDGWIRWCVAVAPYWDWFTSWVFVGLCNELDVRIIVNLI